MEFSWKLLILAISNLSVAISNLSVVLDAMRNSSATTNIIDCFLQWLIALLRISIDIYKVFAYFVLQIASAAKLQKHSIIDCCLTCATICAHQVLWLASRAVAQMLVSA